MTIPADTQITSTAPMPSEAPDLIDRAHAALASAGLCLDDLGQLLLTDFSAWRDRILQALAGTRRFTSLTLAIFAEVTGADVTWLLTGALSTGVVLRSTGVMACVVDETDGLASGAVA